MTATLQGPEAEAQQAWDDLRQAFGNFEKALRRVIETRAWEPLGYASFGEAWSDRMHGFRLTTALTKAVTVYMLIDEGMDRDAAIKTLGPSSGVGPSTFDTLARQKDNGVPAEFATTHARQPQLTPLNGVARELGFSVVREHVRDAPSEPHVIRLSLTADEYAHLRAVAEAHGLIFQDEVRKAVMSHFGKLEHR